MPLEYHFKATADKVFAKLSDPDYLVQRCLDLGELSAECSVDDDGKEVVITLQREVERKLPAFLAKLFDPRQDVEMVERWSGKAGARTGSYTLKVAGQPVTVSAKMSLKAGPRGGCTYTVTHAAKAKIPLIGGRIEAFILEQTEQGARAELEHLAKHL
jgi:hypothetical protein